MLSDIEIAQKNVMEPISKIADKVGSCRKNWNSTAITKPRSLWMC